MDRSRSAGHARDRLPSRNRHVRTSLFSWGSSCGDRSRFTVVTSTGPSGTQDPGDLVFRRWSARRLRIWSGVTSITKRRPVGRGRIGRIGHGQTTQPVGYMSRPPLTPQTCPVMLAGLELPCSTWCLDGLRPPFGHERSKVPITIYVLPELVERPMITRWEISISSSACVRRLRGPWRQGPRGSRQSPRAERRWS